MTNGVADVAGKGSITKRLQKLRTVMAERELEALLISRPENLRYLSGFTGSSGWLFISEKKAILATDFRYVEQAKGESPDFEIIQTKQEFWNWLPSLVSDLGWRKLGFEANFISYDTYYRLSEAIKTNKFSFELVPITNMVEQLRSIKERDELELISRSVQITIAAFEQVKEMIQPGVAESEVAWEIEKFLRQEGSEGTPFEIIVASGPNSALPHAKPTKRMMGFGEPVLLDIGAKINGYCSDFSRTLFLGKADKTFQEIYNIVSKAQATAIEGIKSGMEASQVDHLARSIIERAGYGDAFGHGLGHGIGLATHESPAINPNSSDSLFDGMIFTVEPGIYLAGKGGVRIEDMVVLENGKAKVLTRAGK